MMTSIKNLLDKLCPEGVEYMTVESVSRTLSPIGKVKAQDYIYDGKYPVVDQGQDFIGGYTNEEIAFPNGEYIIFGDHTCITKYVDFPFVQGADGVKVIKTLTNVIPKYFYYAISNIKLNAEYSRHWAKVRAQLIPIPPLEVQSKTVEILDSFTELTAELTTELTARKKQYEYYRDQLLSFSDSATGVEWLQMNELFEFRNGYTPSKSNPEFWTNGSIPWFRMEDIRANGRILSDAIQHISLSAIKKGGLFEKNSFILATTATIGEHALLIADSLANQQFTNLKIRKSLASRINVKYMFYYMFIIDEWCKNHTNTSSFESVDMNGLKQLLVPIPSLAEQERLVPILDRFYALCHDLSNGLPAEIEARRK